MKKLKPSKEVLLQYLYDCGIEETCKLFHLTEDEFNSIIEPPKRDFFPHKYNYTIPEIKANIAKVIADNYIYLRSKFVGNTINLYLSQTDEDIFHNTLLKVISDGIEEDNILKQIEYRINTIRYQTKLDNYQLKGKQTNALSKEARENKADLY